MTLSSAQKILELAEAGVKVIAQKDLVGTPGLTDHETSDQKIKEIVSKLKDSGNFIKLADWKKIFRMAGVSPDFQGTGLNYIHRRSDKTDIYFVANPKPEATESPCTFRIADRVPELWNPETGEARDLSAYKISGGRVTISLRFEPFQSWFIVFRKAATVKISNGKNFPEYHAVKDVSGPWLVSFGPAWGGPAGPVTFNTLQDWSKNRNNGIRYYSGTATYKNSFDLPSLLLSESKALLLDLGELNVMARIRVNGKDCGVAWKPPYRVNIIDAVRPGKNLLEIDVVNLWPNRMIGDARLYPEDCEWDGTSLKEWPEWFQKGIPRPSGRYTMATNKYFTKEGPVYYKTDDPLLPSGLLGPVKLMLGQS